MHHITPNAAKNRLYLIFDGKIDAAEAKAIKDEVSRALKSLKSGFCVVTDLTKLSPLAEDARTIIQDSMTECHKKGMKLVIRLVGDAVVTGNQFQRTSRAAGYTASEALSVAEADKAITYHLMGYSKVAA